ncbi:MAG TPA: UvrB/UvrC motif-containing protein [Phycisphaerae bacterium]|jgi:hypothetical protein|nr:hypothetical protein [Phycisphaerae bacterium]HOB74688.1 UvrB/UvrC motif-containing protein [Phycisphaerae bacterium]HOJ53599.1 UvrB/UvrC motif-containing protein [Phycisphaerae bacterium]HOL26324.1 UvrB/UvrC motif-containing protein [Phycisphaerae bacterium]HPP22523.1 UvrB/UvrC motif-containing protein [Phycisphaerae bacterium]
MPGKDLRLITDDWAYEPGQINVRKIRGADNRIKIQMRVDLGVLQMEVDGRPDGRRPYNQDSLLDYHNHRIELHKRRNGTELGYTLNAEECREVREEAFQYYQRYLANFVLEDYEAVSRDTKRNLDVLDLCMKYAEEDEDRYSLEQYRPYILMMHYRSKALSAMKKRAYRTALAHVECGLKILKTYFADMGQPKAFRISDEVQVLKMLRREIRKHLPVDPVIKARKMLQRAVAEERYEDAARLRDELDHLMRSEGAQPG